MYFTIHRNSRDFPPPSILRKILGRPQDKPTSKKVTNQFTIKRMNTKNTIFTLGFDIKREEK